MFCLNYISNHQWPPWKQLSSGSLRSSVQEQRLGVSIKPLETKGINILLSGMPLTAWAAAKLLPFAWAPSPAAPSTQERAGWAGCHVLDGQSSSVTHTWAQSSSREGLRAGVHRVPRANPVLWMCSCQPTATGRVTWPLPELTAAASLSQRCKATSLQHWAPGVLTAAFPAMG